MIRLFLGFAEEQGGVDVYLLVKELPEEKEASGTIEDVLNKSKG